MTRILLVKTSSLGDVIHNLPVVTDIRRAVPDARIDWVVEQAITDIPGSHPMVGNVIPVGLRRWRRELNRRDTYLAIRDFVRKLRRTHYDCIIDTQGLMKSAVIARLARGENHGPNRRSAREPVASFLYDRCHEVPRGWHAVTRNRALAAAALGYTLPSSPPVYGIHMPNWNPKFDWLPPTFVYCLPGTARQSKFWPIEQWTRLLQQLRRKGINSVIAWGNEMERKQAQKLALTVSDTIVPPTRLNIRETAWALCQSQAVVGVDTGFVHLAAAFGIPTIGLYTDTNPERVGVLPNLGGVAHSLGSISRIPNSDEVTSTVLNLVNRAQKQKRVAQR